MLQVSGRRSKRSLLARKKEFDALLQRAQFEEAKKKEIWKDSEREKSSESRASTKLGGGTNRSDAVSGRCPGGSSKSQSRRRGYQQQGTCHCCGSEEHYIRDCPLKARAAPIKTTRSYSRETTKVKVLQAEKSTGLEAELTTITTAEVKENQRPRIGPRVTVTVEVDGQEVPAIIDTGSPVSIISSLCLYALHIERKLSREEIGSRA